MLNLKTNNNLNLVPSAISFRKALRLHYVYIASTLSLHDVYITFTLLSHYTCGADKPNPNHNPNPTQPTVH